MIENEGWGLGHQRRSFFRGRVFAGVTTRYFGTKEERDALVERDPVLGELLGEIWGKPKATIDSPPGAE